MTAATSDDRTRDELSLGDRFVVASGDRLLGPHRLLMHGLVCVAPRLLDRGVPRDRHHAGVLLIFRSIRAVRDRDLVALLDRSADCVLLGAAVLLVHRMIRAIRNRNLVALRYRMIDRIRNAANVLLINRMPCAIRNRNLIALRDRTV